MAYANELIVRGVLGDNDVVKEINSALLRLRNTYGAQCVSITPLEVQIFLDGVYQRGPIIGEIFFPVETVKTQIGTVNGEPNFWAAIIAVVVKDLTLHNKLKTVQHEGDKVFTAQSYISWPAPRFVVAIPRRQLSPVADFASRSKEVSE